MAAFFDGPVHVTGSDAFTVLNEIVSSVSTCPLPCKVDSDEYELLDYVSKMALNLCNTRNDLSESSWLSACKPYLCVLMDDVTAENCVSDYLKKMSKFMDAGYEEEEDADAHLNLCNIEFNLAYGGKILLHQTKLVLKRGHRYGLVGRNGAGKTTLMNAINNGKLEGWPSELITHYVDSGSNVDNDFESRNVLKHLAEGKTEEEAMGLFNQLNFTAEMLANPIGELSGGWQMKLRLLKAVITKADILLLDEPTNHLDTKTVQWLINYLTSLTDTTVITVSHDTPFMEDLCTDIIHYEKRDGWTHNKLVNYKGKMSVFVEKQPQAKHYFELTTADLKFVFPQPGRLDGIKTSTQKFLELSNVDFRYPTSDHDTLTDVNIKMTLSSRVAVVGANGAGKSTLIKMIVGETKATNEGKCKFFIHHNLRVAYVAQHSFHHVEAHYDSAPADYIAWRFKDAYDREKFESQAYKISEEEMERAKAFSLEGIWSRHMKGGVLEYEIKKIGVPERNNKFYPKSVLINEYGLEKHIKQADEKIAAIEAGLDLRPVTTSEIQRHLDNFGLAREFGTYGKIKGLSGGQKVKLVLAAAMWNCPHMIVMDEPTNYLDREALGALSAALNEYGGAVLMISHNKEFYSSVCTETWLVEEGRVNVEGESRERAMKAVAVKQEFEKEQNVEEVLENAGGNANTNADKYKDCSQNFWGKALAKKESRNYEKAKKKGDIKAMRTILQVPMGKVMPGFEELGDGKTKN
ncbi:hypothetical protein TrRE_jg13565 [Triparma retinervis]|uniref:ABC transporter domain-containing protein n=1 Tax=Triparma retinervis TaxID=2557542 RepID=A0A9W7FDS1_9STRA|nr:hypothetical protein TrRE_jg13565 [Triparma retinervis]